MVIINPSFATQPAAVNRPAGPAPVLAIGRVLAAVVAGQRADHLYELASGNLRMMAESQTALRHGEKLLLQVTGKDHKHRPQLQILSPSSKPINDQLRAALPQQQSVGQLLANLNKLAKMPQQSNITELARDFISAIAGKSQTSDPAGLRQAILQSGLFLESQIAKGEIPPKDLKRALLKLSQDISHRLNDLNQASIKTGKETPLPREYSPLSRSNLANTPSITSNLGAAAYPQTTTKPSSTSLPGELIPQSRQAATLTPSDTELEVLQQLLRDVRGSIARQESHQLLHLQQSDKSQSQYMVEIPVRDNDDIDVWQLHLQKFNREDANEQSPQTSPTADSQQHKWTITLSFDLPGLGPIRAKVSQNPDINIQFSAEKKATSSLIESQCHQLIQSLSDQGITTENIQCRSENITVNTSEIYAHSLLDTQA
ncbi:Uncharacterised protein [Zhongshania aliphaticivorans]|uniref:Flagellar hook-length control protein-like C-terminal domain-containing protein n=1 Tax=Zhongshania aliphaticivorans TaxID=1470434 RepID=A0A5S9Q987_9GAMM|nr:flagellar hook-length control protein FliK [Zhongshania aliphaticivorans]CAA0087025.1 Uncharacterised protein [Zhongshania aliphaticivorans]CAA0113931.1 Uncharacterised protein [Zhongshania aliphaticivorans]